MPSLIESVKVAGLVLIMDKSDDYPASGASRSYRMLEGVDGVLRGNGILRFNEMIDM